MGLALTDISLNNFRNYERFSLHSVGSLTIFVGENAVGKSNLLESIQFCTALASFRHPTTEQIISSKRDYCQVNSSIEGNGRKLSIEMRVSEGKRQYFLNGKKKNIVELKGIIPAVIFTPDDLSLMKSGSSAKREEIDDLGCQLSRNYYSVKKDYEKVVQYKNRLLKESASAALLHSINDTLLTCATQLTVYRTELFNRLLKEMKSSYHSISRNEEINAIYIPSWIEGEIFKNNEVLTRETVKEGLAAALDRSFNEERARGRSLIGPHLDKILFFIENKEVAAYASQGQRRSAVLALKIAEVIVLKDSLGQSPVLLLDDVMSELDEARRNALISLVEGDIQTFITTTNLSYFNEALLERASIVNLPPSSESIDLHAAVE